MSLPLDRRLAGFAAGAATGLLVAAAGVPAGFLVAAGALTGAGVPAGFLEAAAAFAGLAAGFADALDGVVAFEVAAGERLVLPSCPTPSFRRMYAFTS